MRTNTNHAKKLLPLLFTMLLPLLASAQTKVEIDGIWYNLVSKLNQAEVTFKGDSYDSYRNEYSGSITIPATITYNGAEYDVTSIGENAFYSCSSLTTIIIPEGIISIGNHAFDKCGLTAINIPEGVTSIGEYAFYGCSSLTNITIPESVTIIGDYAFYCCSVTNITIPEGVANIGRSAFQYCPKLISITISGSVKNIGASAFEECSKLNNVTMLEGVKSIENDVFYKCSNLTYISLPESLESIDDRAFAYCSSLESINIPDSLTSIGYCAFYGCGKLNDVHINCIETWCKINFVSSGLFGNTDYTSNPLYYADNLYLNGKIVTKVTIPEGMTSIRRNAFYRYNKLTDITIPNGVTSIGDNAFYGCSNLISVNFPEVVEYIGEKAFYGCSNLTTITIPKGKRLWIQSSAFEGCSSLTSIVLPQDIEVINSRAFSNCPELTDVYCFAVNLSGYCSDNAFDGSLIEYATLHIPENAIESYKSTVPWSSFGNIVSLDAAITRITLSASSATLTEGETLVLTMTTTPEDADRNLISWSSNNPSVATIDNTGKVTAIAPGTATITATANDGSGVSASCEVTVKEKLLGKCEVPTIGYIDSKILLTCETEGAKVITTVTDVNDDTFEALEFDYIPTKTFTAYATKSKYEDSDAVSLTLCWIPCTEEHEDGNTDSILTIPSHPVLIQCQGGVITITGLADGTEVTLYTTDGTMVAHQQSSAGEAKFTVDTNQVYLVHIGDKVVKIGM